MTARVWLAVIAACAFAAPAAAAPKRKAKPRPTKPAPPPPPAEAEKPAPPEAAANAPDAPPSSDPRIAHADQLFAEGKALMATDVAQACDKFDASLRENPAALGTLLNVALCAEKLGRVATAYERFTEARDRAKEQNLSIHQSAAEEHLAILAPQVPHLGIALTEPLPELTVLVDDRVIPSAQLAEVAVDPGERVIVVSAPGRLPFRTKVTIAASQRRSIAIPALARSITVTSSRRRIGQITTVAGVAALGTSLGLGLYANHVFDREFDRHNCTRRDGHDYCNADGLRNTSHASSLGNVATAIAVAGGVVTVVGAALWIWSPSSSRTTSVAVVPSLTSDAAGLTAVGHF